MSRYFLAYLTFFLPVAPSFRTGDPRVASRTDKIFAKALDTLADVDDKAFSAYLYPVHRKPTQGHCLVPATCGFRPSIAPIARTTLRKCLSRITRDPLGRAKVWTTW